MSYTKIGYHNNELLLFKNTTKNFKGDLYDISDISKNPITRKASILLIPYDLSNIIINNKAYYIFLWNLNENYEVNINQILENKNIKMFFNLSYFKLFFNNEFKNVIDKLGTLPFLLPIQLIRTKNVLSLNLIINIATQYDKEMFIKDNFNIHMSKITLTKEYQNYLREKYNQFLPHEVEEIYDDEEFGTVSTQIELIFL